MAEREDLAAIDAALIALRRLWTTPRRRGDLRRDVCEGVPMSHVLVVDAVERSDEPEVMVGTVAEQLSINESTASRLVDATVRAGLVDRRRSSQDSRRAVLTLTDDGRQLYHRSVQFRLDYLDGLLGDWSPDDRTTFARLLGRFAAAVDT